MMTRRILLFVFIFCVGGLLVVDAQNTTAGRWTTPQFLGDGWWQSMTLDQEGELHVGWYGSQRAEDGSDIDQLIYTMRKLDGSWTPQVDAIYTGLGGFTVRNALAATSDGVIHVLFRAGTAHYSSSAAIVGASEAANWSEWRQVSDTGYYLSLISDKNDVLHAVFSGSAFLPGLATEEGRQESSACFLCYNLFYRRSMDGGQTWGDLAPLSTEPNTGSDRVKIQQGPNGRLYITWDEGLDWYTGRGQALDVRMVYSDDSGLTWSKPVILDGGDHPDRRPIQGTLTELQNGSIMMVWRYSTDSDRNIYYQISNNSGETWTEPTSIPRIFARSVNESTLDHYTLLTDRLGTVHLFMVGQSTLTSTTNAQLYDITYRPQADFWRSPQRIYYSPDEEPEWPEAVFGLGNDIHLTFFTRGLRENVQGTQNNTAQLRVYYSYLTGNLPAAPTVEFRPTETMFPTPTVFQNIDPSPTPLPTLEKFDPGLTIYSYDNYAAQTVLGGMFLAALFCGGVLLLVRFIRRR
ncbi:MAG: sialidase family protein [Anaerolineae bacterium]